MKSFALLSFCGLLALSACSNPFTPVKCPDPENPSCPDRGPGPLVEPPAPPATTPEQLMDNLARAMRTRDKDLYESLLDEDFLFTEANCLLEVVYSNNFEEELQMIAGSRDGSQQGIFDKYRDFSFDFELIRRFQELGSDHPEAYPDDPNGHPDEDWEVFYGRVQMLLLDENGDGFRVDQNMTYKLRLDPNDGTWKIVRWIDDPLGGADCAEASEAGKRLANALSWAALKQKIAP